jgi:hypothetical protein
MGARHEPGPFPADPDRSPRRGPAALSGVAQIRLQGLLLRSDLPAVQGDGVLAMRHAGAARAGIGANEAMADQPQSDGLAARSPYAPRCVVLSRSRRPARWASLAKPVPVKPRGQRHSAGR